MELPSYRKESGSMMPYWLGYDLKGFLGAQGGVFHKIGDVEADRRLHIAVDEEGGDEVHRANDHHELIERGVQAVQLFQRRYYEASGKPTSLPRLARKRKTGCGAQATGQ